MSERKLKLRREGRNQGGKSVMSAHCPCGWVHMTAYRFWHKNEARDYLCRRFNAHPCLRTTDV